MKAMILMFNVPSCQLVRSHIQAESRNSTILQSCIFNFSQHQPEVSSHRHEFITTGSQNLSNQSGMKESQNGSTCQFITLFQLIHLTQSNRTVLTNLKKSNLLSFVTR
ncbi:unnamed protein product, partial [Rotaria sp. Silwood1]